MDSDDVVDYMVMEAVALKANQEQRKAEKELEKQQWQKESIAKLEAQR